jgi:hypothetical protein
LNRNPLGVALKDSSDELLDRIGNDVQNPQFFKEINNFFGIELLQGKNFVKIGHYNDYEQVLCSIEGVV